MAKLRPTTHRELVQRLKQLGFQGPFSGGRHLFMIKGNHRLTIPNPHRGQISADLLKRILKQGGITRDEWLQNNKVEK